MKKTLQTLILVLVVTMASAQLQVVATFDNLNLPSKDTFWNGSDGSGAYVASGFLLKNDYNAQWASWSGWSYSNKTDSVTAGFGNQYSCNDISGVNGTGGFAVSSGPAWVILPRTMGITGAYVNNAAYAAISMKKGDAFAKKFGGTSGDDKDWFLLKAYGYRDGSIKDSAEIYLADFRSDNNAEDYILDRWTWFDLKSVGDVDSFQFSLSSSDNGQFGMNTPASFCLDDWNGLSDERPDVVSTFQEFTLAKDTFYNGSDAAGGFVSGSSYFPNEYNATWKTWSGWAVSNLTDTADKTIANQYSSFRNPPVWGNNFAVGFGNTNIRMGYGPKLLSDFRFTSRMLFINNTVFTHNAIKEGSAFSKKFGGPSGNDPDYFILNIVGVDYLGVRSDTIKVVLADYRFENNKQDYILDRWEAVDLNQIMDGRSTVQLEFFFESSDTGQWGINTPSYFAIASFNWLYNSVNENKIQSVSVYPNPSSDYISIQNFEAKKINIYDLTGKQVDAPVFENKVDIRSLKHGVYYIKSIEGNKQYYAKFVKI
jgi:hypothetical protein